jgi:amidase
MDTSPDAARVGLDRRSVLELAAGSAAGALLTSAAPAVWAGQPQSDIVLMDASALSQVIAARKVSCVEVMNAYLDHIDRLNPKVNAIVALQDRPALIAQARERDTQVGGGEIMGPLHGFPHAVKDLFWVRGIRTTSGSPIFKDFIPDKDSPPVARLRKAGAIFIGKTNAPEFGLGSHTYNPVYGATLNAYDQTKSAGGSSGGAAVSTALRLVPVADGGDFGGSLRNPAGWNNVFGLRPSFGVVATGGDVWQAGMGVNGPMARSVADLALLLSVQAGYDPHAPLSWGSDGRQYLAPLGADMKGKKIAWLGDFGGFAPYEPGVLELCRTALKSFEAIGCVVEEAVPDMAPAPVWEAFVRLRWQQDGMGLVGYYNDPAKRALLKPEAIWEAEGALKLSAVDAAAASAVRTAWFRSVSRLFERYDYLVAPTAQVFPFDVHETWPHEIASHPMSTYSEWMKAVCLISMTDCPSLAVPAGFGAQGLPMGLQIIAPVRRELDCLRLAYAYEQATQWTSKRPPPLLART